MEADNRRVLNLPGGPGQFAFRRQKAAQRMPGHALTTASGWSDVPSPSLISRSVVPSKRRPVTGVCNRSVPRTFRAASSPPGRKNSLRPTRLRRMVESAAPARNERRMTVAKSCAEAVATGSLSAAMQSGSHNARMIFGRLPQRRIQASRRLVRVGHLPRRSRSASLTAENCPRRKARRTRSAEKQMERLGRGRGQQAAALFADERHLQTRRRIEAVHDAQLPQQTERFVITTHENMLAVVENQAALGIDETVGASAEQGAAPRSGSRHARAKPARWRRQVRRNPRRARPLFSARAGGPPGARFSRAFARKIRRALAKLAQFHRRRHHIEIASLDFIEQPFVNFAHDLGGEEFGPVGGHHQPVRLGEIVARAMMLEAEQAGAFFPTSGLSMMSDSVTPKAASSSSGQINSPEGGVLFHVAQNVGELERHAERHGILARLPGGSRRYRC